MRKSGIKTFFWLAIGFFVQSSISQAQPDQATQDLFLACQANDKEKVQLSLANGASVNATDAQGYTPLYHAMRRGNREIMNLLLAKGADVNYSIGLETEEFGNRKMPVLMWAIESGDPNMVEYLLEKGANRNVRDSQCVSALCLAAGCGNFKVFKCIANVDADFSKKYQIDREYTGTILHAAVTGGNVQIVEFSLDKNVDIEARDSREYSPLYLAALNDNLPIARLLIERGAYIYSGTSYGTSVFNNFEGYGSRHVIDYIRQVEKEKYKLGKEIPAWTRFIEKDYWGYNVDIKGLEDYIRNDGAVSGKDYSGNTVLHLVAEENLKHSNILPVLVDTLGLDVNVANVHGETPLHKAVEKDQVENVVYLLDRGANCNSRDKQGNTPLNTMANNHFNGKVDGTDELAITELLLDKEIDVNTQNVFGHTALYMLAADNMDRHLNLAQMLIEHGADVNLQTNKGETPLHHAAEMGKLKMVELLLEAGARIDLKNVYGYTPIQVARYDAQEKWDLMFQYKKDVSVIEAVYYSQDKILEDLITAGGDVDSVHRTENEATGLIIAAKKGNAKMVRKLLELGAKINAQDNLGYTGLHYAAQNGHDDVVWLLLDSGADVTIKTNEGQTAIDLATANNKLRSVQIIKDAYPALQPEPTSSDIEGEKVTAIQESEEVISVQPMSEADMKNMRIQELTGLVQNAFHKAVIEGDVNLIRKMIEGNPAYVNEFDSLDSTPLMYAAYIGHLDAAKILLEYGANINSQNKKGLTCLHLAVLVGNTEMVQLLLESDADPSLETTDGINALEAAVLVQQDEIAKIIKEKAPHLEEDVEQWKAAMEAQAAAELEEIEAQMQQQQRDWEREGLIANSDNPFHLAVIKGELEKVKELIESDNIDVNGEDGSGRLPISYAACMGNREMVDLLIKHGADINKIDNYPWLESDWGFTIGEPGGWGVLHYVVDSGNMEMLEFLINRGADVNMKATKESGISPIFMAVELENSEIIETLIKAGADLNLYDKYGSTVLHKAASSGKISRIKLLLDLGIDIELRDANGNTALMIASRNGQDDALLYLLKHRANLNAVDEHGNNALHMSLPSNYTTETTRILIEYGIDINHVNDSGDPPIFKLFNYGYDLEGGVLKNLELMIQEGADMTVQNKRGDTILHLAVDQCSPRLTRLALKHVTKLDTKDNLVNTALAQMVDPFVLSCSSMEMIQLLIENGADPDFETRYGWTCLHGAVARGWPEAVTCLLENGASVNVHEKKREHRTPLHVAVSEENTELVRILIDYDADMNAQDKRKETPLHRAVEMNNVEITEQLLEAGARYDIPNINGHTAEYLANYPGKEEILSLFQ